MQQSHSLVATAKVLVCLLSSRSASYTTLSVVYTAVWCNEFSTAVLMLLLFLVVMAMR